MKKLAIVLLAIFSAAFLLVGCSTTNNDDSAENGNKPSYVEDDEYFITDVKVKSMPTQLEFVVGESVNLEGMTFEITWNDGYVERTDASYAVASPSVIGEDTKQITVYYDNFSFVIDGPSIAQITGIGVSQAPLRTAYVEGEYFNQSGMVVSSYINDAVYRTITDYDYSPKTPLTKDVKEITITKDDFVAKLPINVCDGFVAEAESGERKGGEAATSGMVAQYASGGSFVRNFKEGDTLKFKVTLSKAYKVDVIFVGSSAAVAEYETNGAPLQTKDMKANDLFSVSVNGQGFTIGDEVVFHGGASETATYELFANWENVKVLETVMGKGVSEVAFTFKNSPYKNADDSPASAFYDKFIVIFKEETTASDSSYQPTVPEGSGSGSVEIKDGRNVIEAENVIVNGAVQAGDKSVHPDYANSGVAGGFSNKAFAKDFDNGATLKIKFTLSEAKRVKIKLYGASTSTGTEIKANEIFSLYVNGEKKTLSNDAKIAASDTAWAVLGMDLGEYSLSTGEVEITVVFDVQNGRFSGAFFDYFEITIE